ncbi:TAXI family TRAP transporter solute-binding subunit [Halomonas sp. KO116]|uniref:TAXI family TRAP transporter solute-binding subunit n=1 Tax=Halomonas sp. KO116 TaxID=1504981 RepID=UPI0004E34BEF|nr:TAXI family TRAP transporter solute-binding subunit [Halomonas sp. KO116]AJY49985.1 TRAP transporter solute receptor, TAXI family [Halomonas sp. KO116]
MGIFTNKGSLLATAVTSIMLLPSIGHANTDRMNIVTASPGGLWYSLGARYSQILEQNIEGLTVTSSQGGSVPNARQVNTGEADIGVIYTDLAQKAYDGTAPFREELENLRILAAIAPGKLQVAVPKDSDIQTLEDLSDRRINPTPIGWGTRDIAEMVLETGAGLSFDSIQSNGGNVFGVGHDDGMNMMVNGQLDTLFFLGGAASTIMSLDSNPGVRLIPIDGEVRSSILESEQNEGGAFFADEVTGDMYEFIDQPVPTIGVMQVFIVNKDLPEERAYEMVKILYEQREDLVDLFAGQAEEAFDIQAAPRAAVIPFHPGALRYLEEQGVTIAE